MLTGKIGQIARTLGGRGSAKSLALAQNRILIRYTVCYDWDVSLRSLAGPLAQSLVREQIGMLWGCGLAKSLALARFSMMFSYAL